MRYMQPLYHYFCLSLMAVLLWMGDARQGMAQKADCAQVLSSAQQLYSEGKLLQIEPLIKDCLKSGFTQQEKEKAYRLLTLAFLFTEQKKKAEDTFVKLIRMAPDFVVDKENDPMLLQRLYEQYRTSPVVSFMLTIGPNRTSVNRMAAHGTTESEGSYVANTQFQVGIGSHLYLGKQLSLQLQVLSTDYSFNYKNTLLGYSDLQYQEQQRWVSLPLSIAYHFGQRKAVPYIFVGGQYQRLLSSEANVSRQQDIGRDIEDNNLDVSEQRHTQQIGLRGGIGLHYRLKRFGLMVQASYTQGLFNQAKVDRRYSNSRLLYGYGYVDDDFKLQHLAFEVGLTYSIYNPKKLKGK